MSGEATGETDCAHVLSGSGFDVAPLGRRGSGVDGGGEGATKDERRLGG